MSPPDSSVMRKRKELMALNEFEDENIVVKSPYMNDPHTNPCIKEQNIVMKCIVDNLNDKETACQNAYENYKLCQKFWNKIKMERFLNGINPTLPPPEERETIKAEHRKQVEKVLKR